MNEITYMGRQVFKTLRRSTPCALITTLDPWVEPVDARYLPAVQRLDLVFHDITTPCASLILAQQEQAAQIAQFLRQTVLRGIDLICVCEVGMGRSAAIAAAAARLSGLSDAKTYEFVFKYGTYNRRLYKMVMQELGRAVPEEPKASVAVRVKYPPDRLQAFLLSLKRQRWTNWECVVVTDGPDRPAVRMAESFKDDRITVIETPERKCRWGHPWRQRGIYACTGDYLNLQNDDNYLTPGFLEQMVMALEHHQADLCIGNLLHNYAGYRFTEQVVGNADLGSWMASRSLMRRVRWKGTDMIADQRYLEAVVKQAKKVIQLPAGLFVHN